MDLSLTIEVGRDSDSEGFMKRTWNIQSRPYQFLSPTFIAFSAWYFNSVEFCGPYRGAAIPRPLFGSYAVDASEEIPPLKNCSHESPCKYEEGDCGQFGDESCQSGLVCGVQNCYDFVAGMTGSCCVQLSDVTYELHEKGLQPDSEYPAPRSNGNWTAPIRSDPVPGGFGEWTSWTKRAYGDAWIRRRERIYWPTADCHTRYRHNRPQVQCGTEWYQHEVQRLD